MYVYISYTYCTKTHPHTQYTHTFSHANTMHFSLSHTHNLTTCLLTQPCWVINWKNCGQLNAAIIMSGHSCRTYLLHYLLSILPIHYRTLLNWPMGCGWFQCFFMRGGGGTVMKRPVGTHTFGYRWACSRRVHPRAPSTPDPLCAPRGGKRVESASAGSSCAVGKGQLWHRQRADSPA